MEHHSRKRKLSDCSERKSCTERHMDVESPTLRHRRKDFKSSNSSSESSSEMETKKKSKKKKEKKSRKHSKKSKKHKKKKKLKAKPKESEEISEDCKLSGKKDFKFKHSLSVRLQSGLEPGPMQNKDVREVSQPAAKKRSMAPMTKEEYEKQQSVVRRVYDPETGRHRLVKGDGEIIEEIVSQQRHREINKTATKGDGAFFQAVLGFSDK